jgi:hypothetical protein
MLFSVGNGAVNAPRYWQWGDDACTLYRLRDEISAITPRFFYFLKTPRASPFKKEISNEITFNQIHLAGQYL